MILRAASLITAMRNAPVTAPIVVASSRNIP
ncbi:unnamed protein product, partial [marine sediment metagenome]